MTMQQSMKTKYHRFLENTWKHRTNFKSSTKLRTIKLGISCVYQTVTGILHALDTNSDINEHKRDV